MSTSVHKEVFKLYEIAQEKAYTTEARKKVKYKKEKVRKTVNRALNDAFNGKEWNELTDLEQKRFLCIIIKEKILKLYVDKSKHNRIRQKIDAYADKAFIEAATVLHRYNKQASTLNEYFYSETYNEDEKKKAYNEFCYELQKYNAKIPVPSYDEWVHDNEKALNDLSRPLTIYNYARDYYNDSYHDTDENEQDYFASQQEIDHIIIKTLLKELSIKIDVKKIKKCLEAVHAMQCRNLGENDELLLEYDDTLSIDRETQQNMIDENIEYQICQTTLDKLDFVIK